ncbi:MAG: ferrochelatase [Desulfurobacteriaceae bacterium]
MKEAVLLTYMGAPSNLSEIRPFLYKLFSDRDLINFGVPAFLQKPLAFLISTFRAPKVKPQYKAIGGGSPLVKYTQEQAKILEEETGIKTFVGMLYSEPLLEKVVKEILEFKPEKLYVLTLYPHYSRATAGACIRDVRKYLQGKVNFVFTKSWCDNLFYIKWIQELIEREIQKLKEPFILFSAHSLPKYFVEQGDIYVKEIERTVNLVMEKFKGFPFEISYQSKVGPIEWLEPSVEETLEKLAKNGIKEVLVFPISFVSEHIETLFELDIEYKELAENLGLRLSRVKLDHKHPLLIKALTSEVDKMRKE